MLGVSIQYTADCLVGFHIVAENLDLVFFVRSAIFSGSGPAKSRSYRNTYCYPHWVLSHRKNRRTYSDTNTDPIPSICHLNFLSRVS
ncbi:uncharacterized protein METZ01_LOCUS150224 [marine metagenome]|uniref:Uncharacterized protein n=1 Tax=marine metagenome TaxID=408172 RepID=A0A382A799_9ZZZZ